MSRSSTLILFGVLTIITPFSGLPVGWLEVLLPLYGLAVVVIAFSIRSERVRNERASTAPATPPLHDVPPSSP